MFRRPLWTSKFSSERLGKSGCQVWCVESTPNARHVSACFVYSHNIAEYINHLAVAVVLVSIPSHLELFSSKGYYLDTCVLRAPKSKSWLIMFWSCARIEIRKQRDICFFELCDERIDIQCMCVTR
jgi:hypothetical protein